MKMSRVDKCRVCGDFHELGALGICQGCLSRPLNTSRLFGPVDIVPVDFVPEKPQADRHNTGKIPLHLVPPDAINAIAKVLDFGSKKYALRNWEKGANYSVPYASLMRHLLAFWEGEDSDPESNLPHLYHVLMNAAMLVRYFEQHKDLDDRPKKEVDSK
jgi:hypothetical protein